MVVVNYGSHELLDTDHFEALSAVPGVELVIVDSRHSAAETEAVARVCRSRGWELLALPDNPGFGGAVNRGVEHARRSRRLDAIVLVNPDAVVSGDVLSSLAGQVARTPLLMVCPTIEDRQGLVWFGGGALLIEEGLLRTRGVDVDHVDHPWLTGACLALHPSIWDDLGGMDERYFMYWEDIDLCHRARALGARLKVDRTLRVMHMVGGTQDRAGKSDLYRRYNCRNRLLFAAIHLSGSDVGSWIRHTPGYTRKILLRGGRRPLLRRPLGSVWSVVRGTLEGLALIRAVRRTRT